VQLVRELGGFVGQVFGGELHGVMLFAPAEPAVVPFGVGHDGRHGGERRDGGFPHAAAAARPRHVELGELQEPLEARHAEARGGVGSGRQGGEREASHRAAHFALGPDATAVPKGRRRGGSGSSGRGGRRRRPFEDLHEEGQQRGAGRN
jgi:hypothetical protein